MKNKFKLKNSGQEKQTNKDVFSLLHISPLFLASFFVILVLFGTFSASTPIPPAAQPQTPSPTATSQSTPTKCGTDICSTAPWLSLSNWITVIGIALAISFLIVSILFMVGKALADDSLIARASSEFGNLVTTAVIVAILGGMVQFMCSSVVPEFLYGSGIVVSYHEPTLIKTSCVYLERLSQMSKVSFYETAWALLTANFFQNWVEVGSFAKTISEPIDLVLSSINNLFISMLVAYLVTSAQIFLIKFIQPFALLYLLPIGIVMRAFLPFKRFGGALIGVAIALFFFLPLLLTVNAAIMDKQFNMSLELGNACTVDENCCSHVCGTTVSPGNTPSWLLGGASPFGKECKTKLNVGEKCLSDDQCNPNFASLCDPILKKCLPCKRNKEACNSDFDCCIGFSCSDNHCILAKKFGEPCNNAYECRSRVCYNGNCSVPLAAGELCTKKTDCYSLRCDNGKCTECNMSTGEIPAMVSNGNQYLSEGGAVEDITGISLSNPQGTQHSFIYNFLRSLILSIIKPFTMVLIAGIILPLINIAILSIAVRDLSGFFGAETDLSIAKIWGILG